MREGEPLFDWEVVAVQKRLRAFHEVDQVGTEGGDAPATNPLLPPQTARRSLWQRLIGREE